jgi:hypothetical protein
MASSQDLAGPARPAPSDNGEKPIKNKTLAGWSRTDQPTTGVSKATKMHHFGRQGAEIVAIKRIIVIDHGVTAMTPLNIS